MSKSILTDAFEHHSWATLRLLDACLALPAPQLGTSVPGTYGSILDTLRHVVGADAWYLHRCSGGRTPLIDEDTMDLAQLRAAMERNAAGWSALLESELDPDTMIVTRRDDGSETHASLGLRLAQVVHHGTDHRSQVCTALTALGVEPPLIDLWDFGADRGQVTEIPPSA
jgi:uncharacterized damage-inducible protein DinB